MNFPLLNMFLVPVFLLLFFFSNIILAQDVFPGSTLYASNPEQSWDSPNKTFSLSFIKESEDQDLFFAAITYNGNPVWKAGGDPGGAVDSSASLRFLPNGNLQLVNGSTNSIVWQSNTANRGISSASLDESGNFILKNTSHSIWSSFDNPSDTILPGQNFTVDRVLRSGLYSFRLLKSGEVNLLWNDTIVYNSSTGINSTSNTTPMNLTSPVLRLSPVDGVFSFSDPTLSNPVIIARSNDYGESNDDTIRFVKLDSDGNMRMYSSHRGGGRGTKTVRWTAVGDQCKVFGYCGDNGICSYDGEHPICLCPSENFVMVDPKDGRKGCKRKVGIEECSARAMLQLDHAVFLTYPPENSTQSFTAPITGCRSNCLSDNACVASTSLADGTGICYMKTPTVGPVFLSGYQSPTLTSTSYVKVCEPVMPSLMINSRKDHKVYDKLRIAVVVLGAGLVLLTLLGGVMWFFYRRKHKYEVLSAQYSFSDYASSLPVQFSYKELQHATKGFKEKLGAGGFGAVYRGVLENKTVVAVKQLEGIEQGERQFRMEVATISSTHHLNLVRLIGFCSERRHRLLVYEFMKNGSLDNYLFSSGHQSGKKALTWAQRYNILLGTAKGITYLHEECRDCIVHCDIKPENILLDEYFNARVSDFGLAKLINLNDQRHRSIMSVRGTRGYLAPEWLSNLPLTSKADVYSYGMVLLEMISGKRNFEVSAETNRKKFTLWAYEEFEKGNVEAIIDKRLPRHDVDMEQFMRVIQASFWCIQEQPSSRPTMGKVVQMVEGVCEIHGPPPILAVTGAPSSITATSTITSTSPSVEFEDVPLTSSARNSSFSSFQTAVASSFV